MRGPRQRTESPREWVRSEFRSRRPPPSPCVSRRSSTPARSRFASRNDRSPLGASRARGTSRLRPQPSRRRAPRRPAPGHPGRTRIGTRDPATRYSGRHRRQAMHAGRPRRPSPAQSHRRIGTPRRRPRRSTRASSDRPRGRGCVGSLPADSPWESPHRNPDTPVVPTSNEPWTAEGPRPPDRSPRSAANPMTRDRSRVRRAAR